MYIYYNKYLRKADAAMEGFGPKVIPNKWQKLEKMAKVQKS